MWPAGAPQQAQPDQLQQLLGQLSPEQQQLLRQLMMQQMGAGGPAQPNAAHGLLLGQNGLQRQSNPALMQNPQALMRYLQGGAMGQINPQLLQQLLVNQGGQSWPQ